MIILSILYVPLTSCAYEFYNVIFFFVCVSDAVFKVFVINLYRNGWGRQTESAKGSVRDEQRVEVL